MSNQEQLHKTELLSNLCIDSIVFAARDLSLAVRNCKLYKTNMNIADTVKELVEDSYRHTMRSVEKLAAYEQKCAELKEQMEKQYACKTTKESKGREQP